MVSKVRVVLHLSVLAKDRPLTVVITQEIWRGDKLAALSTNSFHQTTHGATHTALLEEKAFASVTSGAIGAVVHAARSGETISR